MAGRDPEISTAATLMRPTKVTTALGNQIDNGPDTKIADCIAGVFPVSLRRDPYRTIGGGEMNLRKWWVAIKGDGAALVAENDAIVVPTGPNPGTYRVQQVQRVQQEKVVLTLTIKE